MDSETVLQFDGRINKQIMQAIRLHITTFIAKILQRTRSHLGKVLNVTVNIYVNSISHMNQEDMRYTMEMFQNSIDYLQS